MKFLDILYEEIKMNIRDIDPAMKLVIMTMCIMIVGTITLILTG
mgnify:FL=1